MAKKEKKSSSQKRGIKKWEKITAIVVVILLLVFLVMLNLPSNNSDNRRTVADEFTFKKDGELIITDSTFSKTKMKFEIQIAKTDYDRQLGLMFRTDMDENQAMLFIFPTQTYQSFWMRNTNISLDILFINADKKIVTIHKNTTPLSDQSYPSSEPAKYVLEVLSGVTDKYDIKTGDKVNWLGTQETLN